MRMAEVPAIAHERIGAAEISLPIAALRKFIECPLQGAAQYALGIFEDDGSDLQQWQDEPVAQSILDRTTLLREVFWKVRGNQEWLGAEYARAFRISQLSGAAPVGPFAEAATRSDREDIDQWIEHAQHAGCESLARWNQVRIGRGDDPGKADRILPELLLPLRGGVDGGMRRLPGEASRKSGFPVAYRKCVAAFGLARQGQSQGLFGRVFSPPWYLRHRERPPSAIRRNCRRGGKEQILE